MNSWKKLPVDEPTNGQTVWIRVKYYYSEPFQANYNSVSKIFTSLINTIEYPAYTVARWKH